MPSLLSFLALFVLLMTTNLVSAHEYSSIDTACTRTYTVQADDTCDIIGQKTLTSTYQILAFNLPQAGASCYSLENGAVSSGAMGRSRVDQAGGSMVFSRAAPGGWDHEC